MSIKSLEDGKELNSNVFELGRATPQASEVGVVVDVAAYFEDAYGIVESLDSLENQMRILRRLIFFLPKPNGTFELADKDHLRMSLKALQARMGKLYDDLERYGDQL